MRITEFYTLPGTGREVSPSEENTDEIYGLIGTLLSLLDTGNMSVKDIICGSLKQQPEKEFTAAGHKRIINDW